MIITDPPLNYLNHIRPFINYTHNKFPLLNFIHYYNVKVKLTPTPKKSLKNNILSRIYCLKRQHLENNINIRQAHIVKNKNKLRTRF